MTTELPVDTTPGHHRIPVLPTGLKITLSILILVTGFAGMGVMTFLRKKPEEKANTTLIPLVEVFHAKGFDDSLEIEISGRVVASRETQISTQVSGTVKQKSECCQVGVFVDKDDVLLKIDDADLLLEEQRLNAELSQSKAMLTELKTEMDGAEKDIELAQQEVDLLESENRRKQGLRGSVSQTTLDQARRNLITAKKSLQSLKNGLAMMETRKVRLNSGIKLVEASLEKVQLDLKRTTIKAPISGVIISDPVEEGSFISVGGVVATINDTSQVEIESNLRTDQLEWLLENSGTGITRPGEAYELPPTEVEITTSLGPEGGIWSGELTRYDGIGLDEVTRTIPVRIDVDQPIVETPRGFRALVQNTYVNVKIKIPVNEKADDKKFLAFPATAIQPGNYVWVVRDEKLERCDVTIVNQQPASEKNGNQEMVVIVKDNGLKEGDKIITSPVTQPTVGSKVREYTES